ncbi:MAG: hypothetical protein JNL50_08215 [Phycisphaerae bacterium]|nr:hypothetical protein [Phycisphaerae bacterium]
MRTTRRPFAPLALVSIAGLALGIAMFDRDTKAGAPGGPGEGGQNAAKAGAPKASAPAAGVLFRDPIELKDTLAIRRIVMYRSGVGSFERRGSVENDADVQLRFKTDQINDILKSMVVLDLSGGQIAGVSYGSKEPLDRRLASFGIDISDNPSMTELLGQLRGSKVSVTTADGAVNGTILGVETRAEAQGESKEPIKVAYLNLVTDKGIRSVSLKTATNVTLDDKDLNEELTKALSTLAEYRADRTKTVDIHLRGQGQRNVVVSYVQEMPVWKTSYRLVLPDMGQEKKPRVVMQGWAIVENTTDEDWNNVSLSLVSGRPVSFRMDLYEPLYMGRPEVAVPTIPGVMPRIYATGMGGESRFLNTTAGVPQYDLDGAMEDAAESGAERKDKGIRNRSAGRPGAPGEPPPSSMALGKMALAERAVTAADMAGYSAAAMAQGQESGEVFQYELTSPVTIERQRSAMLPIISGDIEGRRVSIYNRGDNPTNPMRGVEIKNTTKLQFLPGPISVFDGAAYAGDAQIGHIAPGDRRLLAYAVDLDVVASLEESSSTDIRKLRIVDGLLEQTSTTRTTVKYTFTNKDTARERTVVVEQARMMGWTLVEPQKPSDQTEALHRFDVPIAAGGSAPLSITSEITQGQHLQLLSYDLNTLLQFSKSGKASEKVVEAFREAAKRQGAIHEVERTIAKLDAERNELTQDQARIRENMTRIDQTSQLYRKYMQKLTDQEERMDKLVTEMDAARKALTAAQNNLAEYLRGLNVE